MKMLPLPGLDRLLEAIKKYELPVRESPPAASVRSPGEPLLGRPFDPMLAAFYERLGGLTLHLELYIASCDARMDEVHLENKRAQSHWPEPFRSLLVFGGQEALAYRYATVPSLADAQGLQPVVEVDPYEDIYALPVASNVDRFLDTYARYLELLYETPEFRDDPDARPPFPSGVPELIAEDRALVGMLVEGRFDSLMFQPEIQSEETQEYLRRWVAKLRATSR
jgi:hypothetical protein